jgi:hypothetical protein
MRDMVDVADRLRLIARHGISQEALNEVISEFGEAGDSLYAEGFVSLVCRERGKLVPGTRRYGHNIWTLTGREHLAQLMSYSSFGPPKVPARDDRMLYIGFGDGTQPEVSSVTRLESPIAYVAGEFLAQTSVPTYPLSPTKTTVRYSKTYGELELSISGNALLTEAGLFTDGNQQSAFEPGGRVTNLTNALLQSPNSYKVFEPLTKTQNFVLEVSWEVRF